MKGQTAIPVPEQRYVELPPCTWCGGKSVVELVLEPDRYSPIRGVRTLTKRAIKAPACKEHSKILEHQPKIYSCGCAYVDGEDQCPKCHKSLKRFPSQS